MSLFKLAKRSLVFYWRTNLGVLLAIMVSAAVLTGALVVGDSVRYSLRAMVNARLGKTQLALIPQNRFFSDGLADKLSKKLDTTIAPVLQLRGLIANSDGSKRENRIELLGVDDRFYRIGTAKNPMDESQNQAIVLNESLAKKIQEQLEKESKGADIRLAEVQIVCQNLFQAGGRGRPIEQYFDEEGGPVSEFMTAPVETVGPDDSLMDVAVRMAKSSYRRFPVVDNGKLIGLIGRRDVLKVLAGSGWFEPR